MAPAFLTAFVHYFFGSRWSRQMSRKANIQKEIAEQGDIGLFRESAGGAASDAPIFLLGTGWRCGSTLLQRLVCSSPQKKVLLWGEPYDQCCIVQSMARSLLPVNGHWPPSSYILTSDRTVDLEKDWIANLYPDQTHIHTAHRAFYENLLRRPALDRGFQIWGLKEVRFASLEISYLNWLYPYAKFVLLYRNPLDSYASYKAKRAVWFDKWPDKPISSAEEYVRMWDRIAKSFLIENARDNVHLVKYENLLRDESELDALSDFLGFNLNRRAISLSVGSSFKDGDGLSKGSSSIDRFIIKSIAGKTMRQLGY